MAKQNKYATDDNISENDKLTGFDADDSGRTKNYKVGTLVEFVKGQVETVQVTISGRKFILQKHPSNTTNLTTLEVNDVIIGFEPSGSYIMAQYLGGNNTEFFNASVYNIFNGL